MNNLPDRASEEALDRALRAHWAHAPEPPDDGFSQRVMAALPPRAAASRRNAQRWAPWLNGARWTALALASMGAAALLAPAGAAPDASQQLAAACLIGLVVWWSLPGRWSTG